MSLEHDAYNATRRDFLRRQRPIDLVCAAIDRSADFLKRCVRFVLTRLLGTAKAWERHSRANDAFFNKHGASREAPES